ncbi:hypothetical protein BLNAU_20783 [Blattamonas nauphoetae]|uniref:Uncharacterized protein n=1 Tax=Blattamonas nauphoetae TaxID=2049346 RepID=A0ABQ9WXT5_9EUKA|nr:hypothetical protein BLNAU_20783 [Blattamonas nauphoetae]
MKSQPALDVSLEAKAVNFIRYMHISAESSIDAFLDSLGRTIDESSTNFIQSIVVLLSSTSRAITTTTIKMLVPLILFCSHKVRLALAKADLIPQLINTLNPLSLSFTEAIDIHTNLNFCITCSLWPATPFGLTELRIEDGNERQAVHETVFQQVVAPSEKYISHVCVNRFSISDGGPSEHFLELLANLIQICPYHQPTMDFVLHMPVFLTIPSCLTFFENDDSISHFVVLLIQSQQEWNDTRGTERQMSKIVQQMLRMEGIEDMISEKLWNDQYTIGGEDVVATSIEWNNLLGMNLPEDE